MTPHHTLGSTMRVLKPHRSVLAFYDGRIAGRRAHSPEANWLDDGAYSLGVAAYAVLDGGEALVFDTHISVPHAEIMRHTLEEAGARSIRVALSHWHRDHIAGTAAFADCEIIANTLTARALDANRAAIEGGDPAIRPLVMPTTLFDGQRDLAVGGLRAELRQAEIHSHDGTVLFLPDLGLLIAGDTLEDPVTYVSEPGRLAVHLGELRRMAGWPIRRILPSHGAADVIAGGGYGPGFIDAAIAYAEALIAARTSPDGASPDLRTFAADAFAAGEVGYFEAYEAVHRRNLAAVLGHAGPSA